ncbi:MAG: ADP-ribosylglycohydrolase family protein [Clostridia bacterium]|nr:ADP-ribosylglycohydrolase family protein [Clostridia bacterium]
MLWAVLCSLNDSDTVGAIAGGLAGLFYGYGTIPKDWLLAIQRREWIESMCANPETNG